MKKTITIQPSKYSQFGSALNCHFYIITDLKLANSFVFDNSSPYLSCQSIVLTNSLLETIQETKEPAHILVICPNHYVSLDEGARIGFRKVAIMAANSTPTSLDTLDHFVHVAERTNVSEQENFANKFFRSLEKAKSIYLIDDRYKTRAEFSHHECEYEWFEQGGFLDWGEQQLVPSGELSVLPSSHGTFEIDRSLKISGEIAFNGYPIVHTGCLHQDREVQRLLYEKLVLLRDHAVIASLRKGYITELIATHVSVEPAVDALRWLFSQSERYRSIWEIGFGINTSHSLWPGNAAMNEVHGSTNGAIHFGIGLTPFLDYHLDIICPQKYAVTSQNELLVGVASDWPSSSVLSNQYLISPDR